MRNQTARRLRLTGTAAVIAAILGVPAGVRAQQVTRGAAQLLADFAREGQAVTQGRMASTGITEILLSHERYPQSKVDSLLAGLEDLALHGSTQQVRMAAAERINTAGRRGVPQPLPGTAERLQRVYRASRDSLVKTTLLGAMGVIAEQSAASSFLRAIAMKSEQEQGFHGEVHEAIRALLCMGEEGRAAVRELHDRKLVRHHEEARHLDDLARAGYELHPPARP